MEGKGHVGFPGASEGARDGHRMRFMRRRAPVLAMLLVGGVGPGRAEEKPVFLDSPKQVEALCASLVPPERARFRGDALERGKAETQHQGERAAAFGRRYRVEIPGSRIAFAPYDEDEGELALSPRVVLTAARGALRVWASEDPELAVKVSLAEARRILDAQRAHALTLSLIFDLPAEDRGGSPCAHIAGSRLYTLAVDPVSWEHASKGEVLARGGEGADRPLVTAAQGARPAVEIGELVGGGGELRRAVTARSKDLDACYRAALQRSPALDGTLVVEVSLRGAGAPSVRVTVDSVQDDQLAACVQGAVAKASFPKGTAQASVPIHFALQAPAVAPPTKATPKGP